MPSALHWTDHAAAVLAANFTLVTGSGTTAHTNDAAYPTANLQDDDPSKVARLNVTRDGTAGATTTLRMRWSTVANDRTVRALSALNVRLPPNTTGVFMRAISFASANIEAGTTYNAADLVPLPGTTDRYNLHWLLTQDRLSGGVEFCAQFPASASNYYEIGRIRVGPALVLSDGINSGWSLLPMDPSPRASARRGGVVVARKLPARRSLKVPLHARDYNATIGTPGAASTTSLLQMLMEVGESSPIIAMPRTATLHQLQRLSVYGAVRQLRELQDETGDYYGTEVTIDEFR